MTLKRILVMLLLAALIISSASCEDKNEGADKAVGKFEASVSILCEKMSLSEEAAVEALEILTSLGLDEQIEEIYVATDEDGATFYKVWFGLNLLNVYLNDDSVYTVYKYGDQIYSEPIKPDVPGNVIDSNKSDESNDNIDGTGKPADTPDQKEEPIELNLELVSLTTPIKAGKSATIEIIGEPDTEYKITVRYSSGASTAKGLEAKMSDKDGKVSWTWRVNANTKPGEYPIEIRSGNAIYKVNFTVEKPEDE